MSRVAGRAEPLRAALAQVDARGADQLVVLGDLVGPGPSSEAVIELLASRPHTTVLSASLDEWVIGRRETRAADRHELGLRGQRRQLSLLALGWLEGLPASAVLDVGAWQLELQPPGADRPEGPIEAQRMLPPGPGRLAIARGPKSGWATTRDGLQLCVGPLVPADAEDPRAELVWLDLPEQGRPELLVARVAIRIGREAKALTRHTKKGRLDRRSATVYARTRLGKASDGAEVRSARASMLPRLVQLTREIYRPMSGRWPEDDVPVVHEVRVATRRLQEGLQLFRGHPNPPGLRRAVRRLRALRRQLSARRAVDVQLLAVHEGAERGEIAPAERRALVKVLEERRHRVTRALAEGEGRLRYARHGLELIELAMGLADVAWVPALPAHLRERVQACRALLPGLDVEYDAPAHHELRKAMKRLRYAVELGLALAPDEVVPGLLLHLKPIQDVFGRYNDVYEMQLLLSEPDVHATLDPDALLALTAHFSAARHAAYLAARDHLEGHFPGLLLEVERLSAILAAQTAPPD